MCAMNYTNCKHVQFEMEQFIALKIQHKCLWKIETYKKFCHKTMMQTV
jgi:hypothetical protein